MDFFKNLLAGQLPTVNTEVEIENRSIINLAIALVVAVVIVILVWRVSGPKKITK